MLTIKNTAGRVSGKSVNDDLARYGGRGRPPEKITRRR